MHALASGKCKGSPDDGENKQGGGTVRKVLLLMGLSMLGVLMFVPMAWAHDGSSDNWTPPPSVNPKTGCPHMWVPLASGECVPVSDPRAMGGTATPTASSTPSATATASASPTASATASPSPSPTAKASASASSLPETGGISTGLATGALALLAGGGLFAASIARCTRQ